VAELLTARSAGRVGVCRRSGAWLLLPVLLYGCARVGGDTAEASVATVDGRAVSVAEVKEFLSVEEPLRVDASVVVDPNVEALRLAVQQKLFAREALARGLVPDPPEGDLVDIEVLRARR